MGNKISQSLGLLWKEKRTLNADALKCLYFSFIHSYLNYGNIVWAMGKFNLSKTEKAYKQTKTRNDNN